MMNKGVAIQYGDVAPEAKENFSPIASEREFDNLSQLQQYNLDFVNYANPCEKYQTVLDGKAVGFPSDPEGVNLGLWSEQISDKDGNFAIPIVLELESTEQYSSQGITLTFDTYNGIYATQVNVKWLRITDNDTITLTEQDFEPNSAFYFCRNWVENYNKLIITFYSMNMPQNRLKLRAIDYGYGTFFYGEELRDVKLIQEIDPISTQISINTTDFTLDSKSDISYSFQAKQPLSVYFNGNLMAAVFVKSSKRKSRTLWDVQCEDYIGLMENISYYGGMYNDDNAYEVLVDIFSVAKVPYTISEDLKNETITGYIKFTTCREALMQVAFAIQAVVDTSNSEVVKVFKLDNIKTQLIPLNRIMQGQNFKTEDTVTSVEVAVHTYEPQEQSKDSIVTVYSAREEGITDNIFVKFKEPLWGLTCYNFAEIIESGANYAIIKAPMKSSLVEGYKYEHTTTTVTKKNPVVLASEIEKQVTIKDATLVSDNNVGKILDKCYDWLTKTQTTNLKIVEGKNVIYGDYIKYGGLKYGEKPYKYKNPDIVSYDDVVNVGDIIDVETEYIGTVSGRLIKQNFKLTGNIVIKEAVLK